MRHTRPIAIIILLSFNLLFAVVGEWVSYGSQLTLKDLNVAENTLRASSHGGIVNFDIETLTFFPNNEDDHLKHIDILKYYVNSDSSEWVSYASGITGISYKTPGLQNGYFDFDFTDAQAFTGNDDNVLAVYMNNLSPEIAHFVKNNNRYIFQDTYNQFPGSPEAINDIALAGDTIFLATDEGLIKGWLHHANLKPESAWEKVALDSSQTISCLLATEGSLLFVNENNDVYTYVNGLAQKIKENSDVVVMMFSYDSKQYLVTENEIWDMSADQMIYNSTSDINGFYINNNSHFWVSEVGFGLKRVDVLNGNKEHYIPNTMLYTKAHSLAITGDQEVAVCGMEGISILKGDSWYDLIFSRYGESLNNQGSAAQYYADTLNIAYRFGGETYVYDAMVSSEGKLFCSITNINTTKYSGQTIETQGPGALQEINLSDLSDYTVYDTTDGIIDGTQGVGGGSSYYLMNRGLAEDRYGNIWVLNAHTLAGETLIKIRPNGDILKYSVEDSGNKLQILAREMTFDKYGRLWIANEARQADEPRTTGGITVFDPSSGVWALITTSDGLVSNDVNSIDKDPLTGNMWVATASGVQMIRTPSSFDATTEFSMNPPIDGLSGMIPVKLRIDPRGNKWILTQSQGVQIYLTSNRWFDEGNGLSTTNSGLLDDVVYDLVFDTENGYAYLLTASGLNRYEIAWTEERTSMDGVMIFPQPFRPGIDAHIAIDGLADQSQVRVSTLDGRVMIRFEADAEENMDKQIVWDGILPSGDYIPRGVYLVFITNIDGIKATKKIAVE